MDMDMDMGKNVELEIDELKTRITEMQKQLNEICKKNDDGIINAKSENSNDFAKEVIKYVLSIDKCSVSKIQRHFKVGYGRAVNLMKILEKHNLVTRNEDFNKPRKIIIAC